MKTGTPFFLSEAQITLYQSDATGEKLTSANPVWAGLLATGLILRDVLEERPMFSSGDRFVRRHQMDAGHEIEIARVWSVRWSTGRAFELRRNHRYVMEIVWYDRRRWYRRTYYGVTCSESVKHSEGTNHFRERQRFAAERMAPEGGDGHPQVAAPSAGSGGEQAVLFVKETPLIAGEYLSGIYAWTTTAWGVRATAHGKAPQVAAVVLGLEIDGALSGFTLTLATGAPETAVDDEVDLGDVEIPATALVRWKVLQAPEAEHSAYGVSVEMTVEVEE